MRKTSLNSVLIGVMVFAGVSQAAEQEVHITASQPTHYFYTPMARVNPPYHLVASLHEVSFSLPGRLQLQSSLFDNIGRIDFGAKYGIEDNLSVGAGLAYSLVHIPPGGHGILHGDTPRFGAFLCYEFYRTNSFEITVTPHTQLFGVDNSIGADLGAMHTPSDFWSIIWEVGTSLDMNTGGFWFNTDGGLRIHPPSIPFLSFDGGVDISEFRVNVDHPTTSATVYLDVIFAMVTR